MWQRVVAKFGRDRLEPDSVSHRTMGFGRAITMWLGANVVVTTILTGMLLVPEPPARTMPFIGWSWVQALLAGTSMNYAVNAAIGYSNLPLFPRPPCSPAFPGAQRRDRTVPATPPLRAAPAGSAG